METNVEIIVERVEKVIADSKLMTAQLDEFKEWNNFASIIVNMKSLVTFSYNLVSAVEVTVNDLLHDLQDVKVSGEDKLNAAVAILDEKIQLGWVGEMFDDIVIKLVIKYAVETLNKLLGQEWDLGSIKEAFSNQRDVLEQINAKLDVVSND